MTKVIFACGWNRPTQVCHAAYCAVAREGVRRFAEVSVLTPERKRFRMIPVYAGSRGKGVPIFETDVNTVGSLENLYVIPGFVSSAPRLASES